MVMTLDESISEDSRGKEQLEELRYKQIINSITDYIYSVRYNQHGIANTIHTPSCFSITGYTVEEFIASPSLWFDIVHSDDRQRLLGFIQKIEFPDHGNVIEHRIWHKCGALKWIQNTIIRYTNQQGTFIGYDGVIRDITQSKIAAEQVRLSEEKFRGVFDLNPDALLLCDAFSGRIFDYNQNFLGEFLLNDDKIKKIEYDYELRITEDWQNITNEVRSKNNITEREVANISNNGIRGVFLLSARIIRIAGQDYIIYKFRNISKRKKQEYILRFIGQRGSLFEGSRFFNDLAIFIYDLLQISHVLIVEINQLDHKSYPIVILADGNVLDNARVEIDNLPFTELINSGTYFCNRGLKSFVHESKLLNEWDVESFVGILLRDPEGKPSGYIAILNREPMDEVTEIQELLQIIALRVSHELENMHHMAKIAEYSEHLEDLVVLRTTELESTVQALNFAKERAESASTAKSSFLSNMSHELRTPLNAILGYASALQKEQNLNEKQKQNLFTIQTSGQHLLSIINEILDYSKLDAGKVTIENIEFNLPQLLLLALSMTKHKANEKMLEFQYSELTTLPELVYGDEKRLRQVILNLVTNAIKYTNYGSVHVRVRYGNNSQDLFYFEVEDTGMGIAEDNFNKIFEPFTQLHHQKSYIEGTGLGLSITKNLIELMKGKIYFRSKLNQGSIFIFEIPLPIVENSNVKSIENELENKKESENLIFIPEKDDLFKIVEFAKTGNFTAIEILISKISNQNPEYNRFCSFIKENCSRYNDDRIIAFCNKYINKS